MNRRTFLLSAPALCLLPQASQAYSAEPFSPALWKDLRETSDVIVMNYRASWSLTCQMKADILRALLSKNADYRSLTFVEVDWDTFGRSVLTDRLGVKRNSTLLVMKNGRELARLEASPEERKIRRLLDQAVAA